MTRLPARRGRHGRGIVPRKRIRRERRAVLPRRRISGQILRAQREVEKRIEGKTTVIDMMHIRILSEIIAANRQWGITLVFPREIFPSVGRVPKAWNVWFHVPGVRNEAEAAIMSEAIGAIVGHSSRTAAYVATNMVDTLEEALDWLEEKGPKFNELIIRKKK